MVDVEVLMPVRNAAETVVSAVRSTLNALGSLDRILVLDDGSTDQTNVVLQSLARAFPGRVLVLRNQESQGVSAGLNRLLDESSARFIARMDADDVCLPWRFRYQLRRLRHDRELLFSGYARFGTVKGILRQPLPVALGPEAVREMLQFENPLCHPTLLCHRSALTSIGGYSAAMAEDYATWMKALNAGLTLRRTAVPVLAYRTSDAQVSGTPDWQARAASELLADREASLGLPPAGNAVRLTLPEQVVLARARARARARDSG